ncbi:hypothetical protein [Kitasatospora sp. NBC_01300]|uniref:hypothetical protein n=1 Tax=Kitasatospora sp. NBC_01300 TaxID=2903574 RepID=UPI002F90FC11|nr:hypothetical protein OG556_36855 [Kitasatospora sp. NBC_01300]
MDGWAANPSKPKRRWRDSRTARTLIVLAGLPLVVLGFVLFVGTFEERGASRTAPVCDAPTPGRDAGCLLLESGQVTRKWLSFSDDGNSYYLNIAREAGSAQKYEVDESLYRHVEAGTAVDLKIWKGMVVRIAHDGHEVSTLTLSWRGWLALAGATLLIAVGTVVTAFGLPGRNPEFWNSSPVLLMGMVLVTGMGVVVLTLVQWPFPVTIGLAVAAWLIAMPTVRYLHTSFS